MRFLQILIAIDQLGNTLLGGWADETISARAWRQRSKPVWGAMRFFIDMLFFWQDGHCELADAAERARLQTHPSQRNAYPRS
jgi:hypothetical protein